MEPLGEQGLLGHEVEWLSSAIPSRNRNLLGPGQTQWGQVTALGRM